MNTEKASSDIKAPDSLEDFSFVVSCGSGCALTYNASEIDQNEESVTIKFRVDMFVNEQIADVYVETYQFNTYPTQIILDESGVELSDDTHPMLLKELMSVFDYLE